MVNSGRDSGKLLFFNVKERLWSKAWKSKLLFERQLIAVQNNQQLTILYVNIMHKVCWVSTFPSNVVSLCLNYINVTFVVSYTLFWKGIKLKEKIYCTKKKNITVLLTLFCFVLLFCFVFFYVLFLIAAILKYNDFNTDKTLKLVLETSAMLCFDSIFKFRSTQIIALVRMLNLIM